MLSPIINNAASQQCTHIFLAVQISELRLESSLLTQRASILEEAPYFFHGRITGAHPRPHRTALHFTTNRDSARIPFPSLPCTQLNAECISNILGLLILPRLGAFLTRSTKTSTPGHFLGKNGCGERKIRRRAPATADKCQPDSVFAKALPDELHDRPTFFLLENRVLSLPRCLFHSSPQYSRFTRKHDEHQHPIFFGRS